MNRPGLLVVMAVGIVALAACRQPAASDNAVSPPMLASPGLRPPTTAATPTGVVLSTGGNLNAERPSAVIVPEVGQPRFAGAWAPAGTRLIVTAWGATGCTHGTGRPLVTGVVAAGPRSVQLELVMPDAPDAGSPNTCTADWQASDYVVQLPPGYSRSRPISVHVDIWTIEVPAAR